MTYPFRFLDYGEDDGSVLVSADLTSAAGVTAAGGVLVGSDTASITYNDNGILLNYNAGVNFKAALSAGEITALLSGFTMTAWVERGWACKDYTPTPVATDEYLIGAFGTSTWGIRHANSLTRLIASSGASNSNYALLHQTGKGTHVRVDWVFVDGYSTFYVDYLPVAGLAGRGPTATPFSAFLGIGSNTAGRGPQSHRVKNFVIRNKPSIPNVKYGANHIAIFGHSFSQKADYCSGTNAFIQGDKAGGDIGDAKMLPTIHRELVKRDIQIPEGKIRNYGVNGTYTTTGANNLGDQITTARTGGKALRIAMLQVGTNDVLGSTSQTLATTYPTLQADYQACIDSLVAAGCTLILVGNTISIGNSGTLGMTAVAWPVYKQRTSDMNIIHAAIVAANPQCVLVDSFTAFGGMEGFSSADFDPGDLHLSDQGNVKNGLLFAAALIANL